MVKLYDIVKLDEEYAKERRFPPYYLIVVDTYEKDVGCFCLEDAYDLKDELTGQKYYGVPRNALKKTNEEKPDSEKISKNKKARFRIRKDMFIGLWFISCPVTLGLYIWLQSYWVFALLLIPLAVGILGRDD